MSDCDVNEATDIVVVQDPDEVNNPKVHLPAGLGFKTYYWSCMTAAIHLEDVASTRCITIISMTMHVMARISHDWQTRIFHAHYTSGYWRTNERIAKSRRKNAKISPMETTAMHSRLR